MRIILLKIAIIISILLAATFAFGQELTKDGRNRYSSPDITLSSAVASGKIVSISSAINLSGSLNIKAGNGQEATFSYNKILKAPSESEAVDFAGAIDATLERTSQGARLILQSPNPAPWSGTDYSGVIEGELILPQDCRLDIDAQYFDLVITGPFKSCENKASFGRLEVRDITDMLYLTTSNRDIIVRDITGEVSLTTSHADIEINNLSTLGRQAYFINENGSISGDGLSGIFDIKNSFGRIRLADLKLVSERSRISGSYSPVSLDIIGINNAGLTVRNTNEDIRISVPKTLSASFSLRVDTNGEINVEDIEMRPSLVDSNRLDFDTGTGGPRVRMSIRGDGNISIRGE